MSVTSTRFEFKCWAAESPPNPPPIMTTFRGALIALLLEGESSLRGVPTSRSMIGCDSHRRWDELVFLSRRCRRQSESHDSRLLHWRSCWSACRNRSGIPPTEIPDPIGHRSLPPRHGRSDRPFLLKAGPVAHWPRLRTSSKFRELE